MPQDSSWAVQSLAADPLPQIRDMVTNGAAAPRRGGLAEWQLNRVAVYTEANLAGQIRIADLAACTGLSASYFFQAFRRSTGLSPYAYIIRHRVARVQRLLIHTRQPLSHVALECGLADQPHLTRLFRRIVGMSPAAWRRMQQATPLSHG